MSNTPTSLDQLIIPIYIDTNVLLDLLASIEGGFSIVEKITSKDSTTKNSDYAGKAEGGTEFGIPNVLSLLKINVSGTANSKRGQEGTQQRETERYHTYGSLLHRLRLTLLEGGKIKSFDGKLDNWASIQPGDFVELRGVFRPNPLAATFRMIDGLMELMQLFAGVESAQAPAVTKSSKQNQRPAPKSQEASKLDGIRKFIQGIVASLETENIRLLVIETGGGAQYRAVISVFADYLRDPTLTELAHKEFRVLGRVVRKLSSNTEQPIDLLQGTVLGGMGDDMISQLTEGLNGIEGMKLPKVEAKIGAPALQVVPLAIYA